MNTTKPPQYLPLVETLRPILHNLPRKIIAIDGRAGLGKTTLGRYLAWRFNVSHAESDLFFIRGQSLTYRDDELNRVIEARMLKDRPIIVDGVAILQLLERLGRRPDFMIYVTVEERPKPDYWANLDPDEEPPYVNALDAAVLEYEKRYDPHSRADYVITLPDWSELRCREAASEAE